ncbi:unnamed protein product [Discula destructiva]
MKTRNSGRNSRTPSRGSKNSRRSVTPPGRMSSSPPPMPGSDKTDTGKSDRYLRDLATDEKISILDPRRFTPTLHANLVGEILSLKRDQEEKRRVIEGLESQLHAAREEEDSIQSTLQVTARENRSLKRQLALLEGGTSSALSELARERDEAVEAAADSKRRLDNAQKKLKNQEDSANSAQGSWDQDKSLWDEERRKTDVKIHALETRLKHVLEEVAAYHAAMDSQSGDAATEEDVEDSRRDSDVESIWSMGNRFSIIPKPTCLADELDFDDESDGATDTNGRNSVMSNYMHMRTDSRASVRAKFHRRINSGESLMRQNSVKRGRFQPFQKDDILSNEIIQEAEESVSPASPKATYTDTGIQYSPPSSPKLPASKGSAAEPRGVTAMAAKWERQQLDEISTEANSRRKRTSVAKPLVIQAPMAGQKLMVSAAAQTADVPLSPPRTPGSPCQQQAIPQETKPLPAMVCSGTQTELPALPTPVIPDLALAIPSIAIHPPPTRPSTPQKSLLPQLQRDFGCQVSLPALPMVSSAAQTEEIRIDQRLDRLPAHLHPSAITSRPTSPAESLQKTADRTGHFTPVPGNIPARNPKRLTSQSSIRSTSARESLENVERTTSPTDSLRKPAARMSSFFTSFQDVSSGDEMDDFGDAEQSDSEFRTALSAPRAVKSPDSGRSLPASSPSSPETVVARKTSVDKTPGSPLGNTNVYNTYKLSGNQGIAMPDRKSSMKSGLRPSAMSNASMSNGMRKATLIQNGISTHQEDAADPPFPIPTRASSKHPMYSAERRRSPSRTDSFSKRGIRTGMYRANSISKGRSAAAATHAKNRHRKKDSRSSSPNAPPASSLPPLPTHGSELATPRNDRSQGKGHRHQNSTTTATTEATGFQSHASSQAANGVVDAIAQTMVGEWMFKYVRRRKSFGLGGDSKGGDDSSNERHKRWVWLAPYERSILWSSKQPSSGSALLGAKSGRKLVIQSVLDVKDDNAPPKGQLAVFNRSILILTPQRALKFTAVDADRHYLWLTALSFLAHSQQDVPDITPSIVSPKQHQAQQLPDYPPSPPSQSRPRPRIRDSIRLAKSHNPVLSPPRPAGGIGSTMSSSSSSSPPQNRNNYNTIPAMPSIPDVPIKYRPDSEGFDSAEPPVVARFGREQAFPSAPFHGRKRSNTGGRVPPPLSFRGFSGGHQSHAPMYGHKPTDSQSTAGDSFHFGGGGGSGGGGSGGGWFKPAAAEPTWSEVDCRSESRASVVTATTANMFEAIGTMRMEAFISPLASFSGRFDESAAEVRKRNKNARRQKSRSRSRSKTRNGGVVRGGVAGWREEYMSTYGGSGAASAPGVRGRRDTRRDTRRDSRYGGVGRENGYRTAGEEESIRGRRNPFEGF